VHSPARCIGDSIQGQSLSLQLITAGNIATPVLQHTALQVCIPSRRELHVCTSTSYCQLYVWSVR